MYGSRATETALNTSDFDLAIFSNDMGGLDSRHQFTEEMLEHLSFEMRELAKHGVPGEFSCVFLPTELSSKSLPAVYFSIAQDGILIWKKSNAYSAWRKQVLENMRERGVQSTGQGKGRTWKWR